MFCLYISNEKVLKLSATNTWFLILNKMQSIMCRILWIISHLPKLTKHSIILSKTVSLLIGQINWNSIVWNSFSCYDISAINYVYLCSESFMNWSENFGIIKLNVAAIHNAFRKDRSTPLTVPISGQCTKNYFTTKKNMPILNLIYTSYLLSKTFKLDLALFQSFLIRKKKLW